MLLPLAAAARTAAEHPASGQVTCDPGPEYGTEDYGYPAGYTRGDLTFGGPYPAADELSAGERYMLAGTRGAGATASDGLPAWISSVEAFCLDYHAKFGVLPPRISPDALRVLNEGKPESGTAAQEALLLNPLTGAAPRLDAAQFAPGDLYVRALTAEELRYIAERNVALYDQWIAGRHRDPVSGRIGYIQLQSDVLYVRAYGLHGVIYENLAYRLSEPDYTVPPATIAQAPLPPPLSGADRGSDCAPRG